MSQEITVIDLPAHRAALLRFESEAGQLDFDIESALSDVWGFLEQHGSAPSGPPFAILHYIDVDTPIPAPEPWDIAAGFPFEGKLASSPQIEVREFPASPGVRTVHEGDYAGLGNAIRILQAWIEAMGRTPAAPPRMIFHTDPAAVMDSGDWRTEIFWPLQP